MANFFTLVKVQLLSFFGFNKILHSKKRKRNMGIGGLVALLAVSCLAIGGVGYVYTQTFSQVLVKENRLNEIIPLMIAISALLGFMLTFYSVGSAIFGFKDYDMLASMPLKPVTIVLSKFLFVYLVDVFFSVILAVVGFIVYLQSAGVITVLYVVAILAACLVSPLLPLALATVVGMGVYYVSSKFKRKNLVQTILFIILTIGVLALSFLSGFISDETTVDVTGVLGKTYFLYSILVQSTTNPLMLLAFFAINVGAAALVVSFVCAFYSKLNAIFTAKRTSRKFKLKEYEAKGLNKALLNKEIKRLFSCPAYAVNSLMGSLLGIFIAVLYSVVYGVLAKEGASELIKFVFSLFIRFMPAMFAFSFMLSPSTASSISVEGQSFWIIKTAPVSVKRVLLAKLNVNALFYTLPAVVSSVVVCVFSMLGVWESVLFVLIAILLSQLGGLFGLLMNLRFPKLKWKNETEAVKQGLATFLTMLLSFAYTIALFLVAYYAPVSLLTLFGIIAGVTAAIDVVLVIALVKKGEQLFNKIN